MRRRFPDVHAEHQVEPLHRGLQRPRQADRARVVHEDVDAAERLRRLRGRRRELHLEPDVDLQRQGLSPARSISRAP